MLLHRMAPAIFATVFLLSADQLYRSRAAAPAFAQPAMNSVQSQHDSVFVELAGAQARLNELDRQTRQYRDELQAKSKTDPIIAELQKVIEPLQKAADRKRASPETYTSPDIERADMDVAIQRERLMERQALFGDDAPLLEQLRHDRITLATELAELQAEARAMHGRDGAMQSVSSPPNANSASRL